MMSEVMVSQYLKLLGCEGISGVSQENLFLLHKKHLETIPYTNWRIFFDAETPSLEPEALFERVILQKSGGYCFELNGLFAGLLRALGYQVTEFFARWHAGENVDIPMRRHRVLLVECSGKKFIADVGVGCLISSTPLEFVHDAVQKKNCRNYRIVKDLRFGNLVQAESDEGFYTLYSFNEEPCFPCDFEYVNYYCSQNANSPFRKKLFLHRQGDNFRIFIENPTPESPAWIFCEMYGDSVRKQVINSNSQLQEIFEKHFGVICKGELF